MDDFFAIVFILSLLLLVVGLIKPTAFRHIPYLKTLTSRKALAKFFGLVAVFSFIFFGLTTEEVAPEEKIVATAAIEQGVASTESESIDLPVGAELVGELNESTDSALIAADSTGLSAAELAVIPSNTSAAEVVAYYRVDRVIDGDTVDVVIDGKVERLRLIGIDTPETVHPSKPVECYGLEASDKAKALLAGGRVSLERDATQGDRDKYGRLLRYVFLEDGSNFNQLMIVEGFAYEYTYNQSYKYQLAFVAAETVAKESKRGLWGDKCAAERVAQSQPVAMFDVSDSTCNIKGNISSSDEKIYHVPGCDSYQQTRISEDRGEQWFCTEQEALSAGWRRALNCD